jgi:hypothetical protein
MKHQHEYRKFAKSEHDVSTNEQFYCIYCLQIVDMHFYSIDKCIKSPEVIVIEEGKK